MATSVQLEKLFGEEYTAEPASWNKRDLLTYAVGIGAKTSEKQFVYDPSFAAFPTYPVVLGFKGTDQDVINFTERIKEINAIKGLPAFDPRRLLKRRLASIREKKSGVIFEVESLLVDPHDTPYARLFSATFNLTAKITGMPFSHSIASPPQHRTDPRVGSDAGFDGVILHGLSTFGFAARAILEAVGDGVPSSLRYFGVRFTAPVVPGDGLETPRRNIGGGQRGCACTDTFC
ncbi:hypothetical protein BJV77DRAFT_1061958 [Russula vinacea]|nr:hypothetical protein BJV77DRAFT_1061958 [Russula vinacea]